jgi:hypothetical protein
MLCVCVCVCVRACLHSFKMRGKLTVLIEIGTTFSSLKKSVFQMSNISTIPSLF